MGRLAAFFVPFFCRVGRVLWGLMDIKSACDSLRASENKEVAALVVQDRAVQRILAVWPMVRREVVAVPDGAGWDELWKCCSFDGREVVELSGLQVGPGMAALNRARGLRLIYPDGSIHQVSKLVLQKLVRDVLNG